MLISQPDCWLAGWLWSLRVIAANVPLIINVLQHVFALALSWGLGVVVLGAGWPVAHSCY